MRLPAGSRKAPVGAANVLAAVEGKPPQSAYDGYIACPIVTGYGRMLLCELDYSGKPSPRIPGIDTRIDEDTGLSLGDLAVKVLNVPGHTLGHIAYVIDDALFCGDTLFGGGCGRLFEGSPAQMWDSLQKLAALPPDTRVYCAHEYTLSNLRFARSIDAGNAALDARISRDTRMRMDGKPTIPSTIGDELATNPFLRPLSSAFCAAYAGAYGTEDAPLAVFTAIRAQKDGA